jgi:P-type Cu+ transporter
LAVEPPSGGTGAAPHCPAPSSDRGHAHGSKIHRLLTPVAVGQGQADQRPDPFTAIDPVCGMSVDIRMAKHRVEHQYRSYYFCCAGCATKGGSAPVSVGAATFGQASKDTGARRNDLYPMHPEVRRAAMGSCPICGMALEPEMPSAASGANSELVDMVRRLWIGAALALPVVLLEMSAHILGRRFVLPEQPLNWIQLTLVTPVVLWAGFPFFERGWRSLLTRNLNMFTLISLGTGTAWIYSVIATVFPQILPSAFRDEAGAATTYFEAAAVIIVLVLVGQVLELRGPRSNEWRYSRPARSCSENGAPGRLRRLRPRRRIRPDPNGRSPACASRRKGADRR